MRRISALAVSALAGSQPGVHLVADVWRGGRLLTKEPLQVAAWQVAWDATRQVQGQAQLTVADPDGTLAPWAYDDMLGVGGSRLRLRYRMPQVGPVEEVSLGWFRIVRSGTDDESWRFHPTRSEWLSTGATVRLDAAEMTWQVQRERFLAPQSPRFTGSVLTEVRWLLDGIMPVGSTFGVDDGPTPASLAYSRERMDIVEDLLASVGAVHRMSDDGLLEVLPEKLGAPVWTIAPSDDDEQGVLVSFGRQQDAAELPNAAVVDGATIDGVQLVGLDYERSGALVFGGAHGRIPEFLQSSILDTQAKVDAAARTRVATAAGGRRSPVTVVCLPHPALQMHEVVTIQTPVGPLTGPVDAMTLAGSSSGVQPMNLGVSVPADQLALIAARLRRG